MHEFVKCRYGHCKHPNEQLKRADAICVGKAFYHKDCYAEKETIRKITDAYINNVDSHPIFGQLTRVVNDIIYKNGVSPEYLLFALGYAKGRVNYPPGLYYLVKDDRIKNAWNKRLAANQIKTEFDVDDDLTPVEGYGADKPKGFGEIV